MSDIKKIKEEFLNKLQGNLTLSEINQIKTDLFGKNGIISLEFKKIGQIEESERKKFASDLNEIKNVLQNEIENKISKIEQLEINDRLSKEKIDVTLPTRPI
jgi:phenylalanyl-tRNA synthetase alpha chain